MVGVFVGSRTRSAQGRGAARTYPCWLLTVKRWDFGLSEPSPARPRSNPRLSLARLRMLLVIDNHDSFTWNLVHGLMRWAPQVHVVQANAVSVQDVLALAPQGIVLSPGPGSPAKAGISLEIVRNFGGRLPIFGVCLGHQVLCEAFGGQVVRAARPMHGRTSIIHHDGRGVFEGVETPVKVGRYHSLVVQPESLPDVLTATAFTEAGELMGVRHRTWPLESVQFHPESFLTERGERMLENAVRMLSGGVDDRRAPESGAAGRGSDEMRGNA
jgi:para-aminobenzoate synthetase component 2